MPGKFKPPKLPDLRFEIALWAEGLNRLAGLDEAGRGAWAGPVAAGAVVLRQHPDLPGLLSGVRDSKQMRPVERGIWAERIKLTALDWSVGLASHQEIDEFGIVLATRLAMQRAIAQLRQPPDHLLVDALSLPEILIPQTSLIKGDARVLSIAAASVLAKTSRDDLMIKLDEEFPGYGFSRHKGYGTARHQQALMTLGPCPIHRFSFKPLKEFTKPGLLSSDRSGAGRAS